MPQKIIEPVIVDSFESIILNIDSYIDKFSQDAIVVFRGVPLSREQQLIITRLFGDRAGWFPNSTSQFKNVWSYEENHSFTMELYNKYDKTKDEIFLPWHLEHIGHENPAIGATWNMEKFTSEEGTGNTLFANICDIYDIFSPDEQAFLSKCRVGAFYGFADDEIAEQKTPVIYDVIQVDKLSKRHALRLSPIFDVQRKMFYLHSFDGIEPTFMEHEEFWKLSARFTEYVYDNENIQQVHVWKQHDLVVVNLFLMVHAVLGGFKSSDRFFHGYWAHAHDGSKYENAQ